MTHSWIRFATIHIHEEGYERSENYDFPAQVFANNMNSPCVILWKRRDRRKSKRHPCKYIGDTTYRLHHSCFYYIPGNYA